MENQELELNTLKRQNETLMNELHLKTKYTYVHLICLDILMLLTFVGVVFVVYQGYRYMPMLEGLNEKYDYINNVYQELSGYFQ